MGFWKQFGRYAIPAAAIAATIMTGGAASPLIGMAIGAGAGAASTKLQGGSWKQAALSGAIGAGTGAIGGGALKGMGTYGTIAKQGVKYAPAAIKATRALTPNAPTPGTGGGLQAPPQLGLQQGQGFLNPLGTAVQRRTDLAGMGSRYYNG